MRNLYLDSNAHLPISPAAAKAYLDFSNTLGGHGHPSSPSEPGRLAASALEKSRTTIASLLGAQKAGQIVFTAGCTQACDWAMRLLFEAGESDDEVVSSPIEHPAIRDAFDTQHVERNGEDYIPRYLDVDTDGVVRYGTGDKIVCIHVQNEIGTIQPLENLTAKMMFSDMSQSICKVPINLTEMNVDFAVFGAHKFGGPGGFGFMYMKDINHWEGFGTGSRYFLDRPGTPDVAATVATAIALEEALETMDARRANMIAFQSTLENGLERLGFEIIGKNALRVPNTTFVRIPGKSLQVVFGLGENGIHVGLGSACGSMHSGPSHIMKAIGRDGNVSDFMRVSQFGDYNENDAQYFLEKLNKVL